MNYDHSRPVELNVVSQNEKNKHGGKKWK